MLDCIVNPDVCQEMQKKSEVELLGFFSDILVAYVQQKHQVILSTKGRLWSSDFKLPKMKYKGKFVEFQRVRAKKSPKIEMMGETATEGSKAGEGAAESLQKEVFSSTPAGPIAPEWTLQLVNHDDDLMEFDGFNLNYQEAKAALLTFNMPILVTGRQPSTRKTHQSADQPVRSRDQLRQDLPD